MRTNTTRLVALVGGLGLSVGCFTGVRRPVLRDATPAEALAVRNVQSRLGDRAVLKAHLRSGGLVILQNWVTVGDTVLSGNGIRHAVSREWPAATSGRFEIPFDSIALLESDEPKVALALSHTALNVWTVA